MRVFSFFVVLFFHLCINEGRAQVAIYNSETAKETIRPVLTQIYSGDFQSAEKMIKGLEAKFSGHPLIPFLRAMLMQNKYYPLKADHPQSEKYVKYLYETITNADRLKDKPEFEYELPFFYLSAYGYLAKHYGDQGSYTSAISRAQKAYDQLKKGFELTDVFAEYYFSTGLYQYYREKYPEVHPIYKSMVWVFPSGDKANGLKNIKIARDEAIFTSTEATIYLGHLYMRYENEPSKSFKYYRELTEDFPKNQVFAMSYCENLWLLGRHAELKDAMMVMKDSENAYFSKIYNMYNHLLDVYSQKKPLSENKLTIMTEAFDEFADRGNHPKSIIYLAYARAYQSEGNSTLQKKYAKLAKSNAAYAHISDLADNVLKAL
ncbi:MAG: hypothetical protein LAT68_05035 [Cyclobacteriaceae bacterium]|nr:hypothetical protein [Cyclobacteriaceae bacterium]MCH8515675.1 hypothetical protein [Cyclobacteriaceae bacterium]